MQKSITDILEYPVPPVCNPSPAEWSAVESKMGTALPSDYKRFIERYGAGSIDNFVNIMSPFCNRKPLNLITEIPGWLGALRQLRNDFGEKVPFAIFPEPNGVLPWAYTDNGDVLYWITSGMPDAWHVCANETRSPDWEEYSHNMTQFLVAALSRQVRLRFLPDGVFTRDHYIYSPIE